MEYREMTYFYCYGIVEREITIDEPGFGNEKVYVISFKDIKAVVSEVPEEEFSQKAIDNNIKNMQWLTKNAPIHEEIVTAVMEKTDILPMKFCTIFKNRKHLEEMLEEKYAEAKYFLNYIHGKVEMNVKVYADLQRMKEGIRTESAEIKKLEEEKINKTPGLVYFVQQKIDLLMKNYVQKEITEMKRKVLEKLKELVEIKQNDILAKKITGKDMVLNVALLVKEETKNDLKQIFSSLKEEFPLCEFELRGPFAPYNFIK